MLRQRVMRLLRDPKAARPWLGSVHSSFSQYGEDRILNVILRPGNSGTYVDVGSHHPYDGSNTYGLYLRGWRGLTVDANPAFGDDYRRWRPHEPHLIAGVSETAGKLTYHEYDNSVFNTSSDARAAALAEDGIVAKATSTIATQPLASMVDEHLGDRHIDLLSVDCEGLDLEVIRSLDLTRRRPTVIIMEDYARLMMFRTGQGDSALHDFLTAHGYAPFAQLAFSALYIADDYRELMQRSPAFELDRIQGGILS